MIKDDIRAIQEFDDEYTIYDRRNGDAWISSDTTVDLTHNK